MKIKTLKDELQNAKLYTENDNETAEEYESFLLTPIEQDMSGLEMIVNLRCIENAKELPFLRFQNDREKIQNSNWIKIYINGNLANYENKKIIFTKKEMQALKTWIRLNKDVISKHYYQEYDSADVYKNLKSIQLHK
jgi:hypothetical protein